MRLFSFPLFAALASLAVAAFVTAVHFIAAPWRDGGTLFIQETPRSIFETRRAGLV